jgi:hypothetical protein
MNRTDISHEYLRPQGNGLNSIKDFLANQKLETGL